MMLTDPTIIRDLLGFDDMTDINDAIEAALESATATLASKLNTTFDRGTATETFYVEAPIREVGLMRQTEFRLSKGFLQSITSWEHGTEIGHMGTASATSSSSSILPNLEKGIVKDLTTDYTMRFVRTTYVYGFEPDADYAEVYDPAQVPDWLQEAAKLSALMNLGNSPALKAIDDGGGTYSGIANHPTGVLRTQLQGLISEHARYAPLAQLPVA